MWDMERGLFIFLQVDVQLLKRYPFFTALLCTFVKNQLSIYVLISGVFCFIDLFSHLYVNAVLFGLQ